MQVFTRDGVEKDSRALAIEKQQLNAYRKDLKEEYRIFESAAHSRLLSLLVGQEVNGGSGFKKGDILTEENLSALSFNQ